MLNFAKCFSRMYCNDNVVSNPYSIQVLDYIYLFPYVKSSLYHWNQIHLIMVYAAKFSLKVLENFYFSVHEEYWLVAFYMVIFLTSIYHVCNCICRMSLKTFRYILSIRLRSIGISNSFKAYVLIMVIIHH
jgi:hypothetical protein